MNQPFSWEHGDGGIAAKEPGSSLKAPGIELIKTRGSP